MMHASVTIVENGAGCQTYFPAALATDSQFPLTVGEDALAFVTPDEAVHIAPREILETRAELEDRYPVSIAPPTDALPALFDVALDVDHATADVREWASQPPQFDNHER